MSQSECNATKLQTPSELAFHAALCGLFDEWRETLPLGDDFYDALDQALREGLLAYALEGTRLTDNEQRALLAEALTEWIDEYVPVLVQTLRNTNNNWFAGGFEDKVFDHRRAERIVLTETRRIRMPAVLAGDLIERGW